MPKVSNSIEKKSRSKDDSVWKEAIDDYLKHCLKFFFPYIHDEVDWAKGYETLNNELAEITQDSEVGPRRADSLIKVFLLDGTENWLLIHIEVQGYKDPAFAERMHIYNFLIYHKYRREVESLAILTDNDKNYRPSSYQRGRWKSKVNVSFDVVKLKDYEQRWEELERDPNPFAIVVMAHLKAQQLKGPGKSVELKEAKLHLARLLFQRGYSREDVIKLYRFIDWIMRLPKSLQASFREEIREYNEEVKMPILSDFELIALKKGRQEGRQEAMLDIALTLLTQRFGTLSAGIEQQIKSLSLAQLGQLSKALLTLADKTALESWLQKKTGA